MTFSYSRLSTYRSCPQQYQWHYVQKIQVEKEDHIDTLRGLALHDYAEGYHIDPSLDTALDTFQDTKNLRFSGDMKDILASGAERVAITHKGLINPAEADGYTYYPENEYVVDFYGHELITKLDVLLLKRGSAIIVDYKTSKSTQTSYYKEQMAFYRYAISTTYGIPPEAISTKIAFLLAPTGRQVDDFLKDVAHTAKSYDTYINNTLATLKEIETAPRHNACLSFMCRYCEYKKICDIAIISKVV